MVFPTSLPLPLPIHPMSSQFGVGLSGFPSDFGFLRASASPRCAFGLPDRPTPPRVSHVIPGHPTLAWLSEVFSFAFLRALCGETGLGVGFANCQGPITKSHLLFSKIVQRTAFSLCSEFLALPFVRPFVKQNPSRPAPKIHRSRCGREVVAALIEWGHAAHGKESFL